MKVTGTGSNFFAVKGNNRRASFALMTSMAVLALACTSVASATPAAGDHRPSEWATSTGAESAGSVPSLTNDVDAPAAGRGSERVIGLGLAVIGGLGLMVGLAAMRGRPHRRRTTLGVDGGGWRRAPTMPTARP